MTTQLSMDKAVARFKQRMGAPTKTGCRLWLGATRHNGKGGECYGQARLHERKWQAHRLSYHFFVGPIPAGALICHRCDTPLCVEPSHLFAGTHLDNMRDMHKKGRGKMPPRLCGEDHPQSVLTKEQVAEIRASTGTLQSIADRFGITSAHCYNIRSGKLWPT